MNCDKTMLSVGQIIKSKEFEREAPEGFNFAIRRAEREKKRKENQSAKVNKTTDKNISLAK